MNQIRANEIEINKFPYEPTLASYNNCFLLPECSGAISAETNQLLDFSYLRRGPNMTIQPYPSIIPDEALSRSKVNTNIKSAILIPYFEFGHFGHLLTETAGILWPFLNKSLNYSDSQICVNSKVGHYIDSFLKLFDLSKDQVYSPKRFDNSICFAENIILIKPSIINSYAMHHSHIENTSNLVDRLIDGQFFLNDPVDIDSSEQYIKSLNLDKLYISRRRLSAYQRRITNEAELENLLVENGWFIFHPQEFSLKEQIQILTYANVIAGASGSGFHALMAVTKPELKKIYVFTNGGVGNINFLNQFSIQQINAEFIHCLKPDMACKKRSKELKGDPNLVFSNIQEIFNLINI